MPRAAPVGALYTRQGHRKYLNAAERARFLAAAGAAAPEVRTLCLVLTWTGCRISEALSLTLADVQPAGVIAVRSLKKRGRLMVREIPVPPALPGELARVHGRQAPGAPLWPWGRTTAWRHVKVVMHAAGLAGLPATPKGLRHGFGVHAVGQGVPLNLVQKWLGHADIATTAIYTNALGAEERAIAARMW